MIIRKLYLTSFGKFENQEYTLEKGINVLYGLNEAGKSTIHKFIEGMLFGFFKTGVKNRSLNDDHKQYQPRNKNDYHGSMEFEFKGKTYLLHRDFSKLKPTVTLTEQVTGTDITDSLEVHSATKLPDIAGFLGLNYTMYKNTISIAQVEHKDDKKNLSDIVVERLTNLHTTKDEQISLVRINNSIEKEVEEIGTSRAKTKPLFLAKEKMELLNTELKESEQKYQEVNELSQQMNDLLSEQSNQKQKMIDLEYMQFLYENEQKKELYKKAKVVQEECDSYKNIIDTLSDYKDIDIQSLHRYQTNDDSKQELLENLALLKQDINKFKVTQENLYPKINSSHYNLKRLYLEADIEVLKKQKKHPVYILLLSVITLFIYFFIYQSKAKNIQIEISQIRDNILQLNPNEINIGQLNSSIIEFHKEYLNSVSVRSSKRYHSIQTLYSEFLELSNEVKLYDDRINEKQSSIHHVEKRLDTIKQKNIELLTDNNAKTVDELIENISFKDQYTTATRTLLETNKRRMDLLGVQSLASLENEIDFTVSIEFNEEKLKQTKLDIKEQYQIQLSLNDLVNQKQSEIMQIERNHRDVDIIINEYKETKEKHHTMETRVKALQKVQSVLTELSNEISYEFAPLLNAEISEVVKRITNDKYDDIKVDRNLDVKVFDKSSNTNENIVFFSKGTIDQLYLALRIGVNSILSNEKYPFIFDDSFVNYDDNRLLEVLLLIQKEAKERQVIILSCHQREQDIFDAQGITYHKETI